MTTKRENRAGWINDLSASLVVFLVALPLCMGIAIASGMPPARGLVTGMIGGIIVGAISGSPLQVSGPAAGLAVLVFEIVHEHGMSGLALILTIAGAIQLVAGLLKTGRWFRAISPEVIHGMLAGIGILIVIQQFHVALDRSPKRNGPANIAAMGEAIFGGVFPLNGSAEETALLVGIVTISVMLLWERFRPAKLKLVPAALLGIGTATTMAQVAHLGVKRIDVPANLGDMVSVMNFHELSFHGWRAILGSAVALAFIASAETLLSAAAVDQMQMRVRADFDKELAAQGVGNMLCGMLGVLPMTGVIVRSSANVQAGAETRKSTMMHGAWLLLFVVAMPWLLRMIPLASLAGVLILTGIRLIKPAEIRHLRRFGWPPVAIYFGSMITIVMTDLLTGVLVGLGLSMARMIWKLTKLEINMDHTPLHASVDLVGVGTFLCIPKLTRALDTVPEGIPCAIHITSLRYIDHACIEAIEHWVTRREKGGDLIEIEMEQLHLRYRTPVSQQMA
jgi:MFS superfamily sulfate permease-like transporter